jgi:hypothetical protein
MFRKYFLTEEVRKENITKLDIFDFDDTLVYVPGEIKAARTIARYNSRAHEQGKKELKLGTGYYWYSPQSLQPPIIPDPTPCAMLNQKVAQEFYASQRDPSRLAVILTGRPPELKSHVQRIFDDFKLKPDRFYLMPKGHQTMRHKVEHIAKLLDKFPNVVEVEIWDDKGPKHAKLVGNPDDNHIADFRRFLNICKVKRARRDSNWELKIKVNEVPPRDNEAIELLKQQHPDYGKPECKS